MERLKAVCVYCGSGRGDAPEFLEAARTMGRIMARNEVTVIYGGGRLGLMGAVADGALDAGGKVIGVIPGFLRTVEVDHPGVTELIVTPNMHRRKAEMFRRADGFIILPGGLGTLEEMLEMLTWRQLRQHDKPIVLVNIRDYWRPLVDLFQNTIARGFANPSVTRLWQTVDHVNQALPALRAALPPEEKEEAYPAEFDK
ncbi:MAG: TIGR00730 family Rossman fold protein [Alphaproteobacteria bacterium]